MTFSTIKDFHRLFQVGWTIEHFEYFIVEIYDKMKEFGEKMNDLHTENLEKGLVIPVEGETSISIILFLCTELSFSFLDIALQATDKIQAKT